MAWLQSLFQVVYKFFKDNIPTFALAIYQYLKGVIIKKENENEVLRTALKTEVEKKELYDKNKAVSDADVVDKFIDKGRGKP